MGGYGSKTSSNITVNKTEVEWVVAQFADQKYDSVSSDLFNFPTDETKWYLTFHPDGHNVAENKGFVSLGLTCKELLRPVTINATITLVSNKNAASISRAMVRHDFNGRSWGWSKFCSRDIVLKAENGFLVDGKLTIHCALMTVQPLQNESQREEKESLLFLNQQRLFKSGNYNDCVLICADGEVPACRAFLASQSEVFRIMFQGDNEETKTGRVYINDIDADIMQAVTEYASCGKVSNIENIVDRLLLAAGKYLMDDLKQICAQKMGETLAEDNFCHRLMHAHFHGVDTFNLAAIAYLLDNNCSIQHIPGSNQLPQDLLLKIIDTMMSM